MSGQLNVELVCHSVRISAPIGGVGEAVDEGRSRLRVLARGCTRAQEELGLMCDVSRIKQKARSWIFIMPQCDYVGVLDWYGTMARVLWEKLSDTVESRHAAGVLLAPGLCAVTSTAS